MFFNSIGWTASRSSLAAESPSELINRYLVFAIVRGTAQFESCRNRGAAATDDGNSDWLLFGQTISSHDRTLSARAERNIQYAREYVNRDDASRRPRLDMTVPTPHSTSAQPPALALKFYVRAFSGYG
jgi:hypothetical protein